MAEVAKIRCDACPVLCFIAQGRAGDCDCYANVHRVMLTQAPMTPARSLAALREAGHV